MELRKIPEINEIAEYLRTMKFKMKLFGGCDMESVLDHFAAVSEKYNTIITTLTERYEGNEQGKDRSAAEKHPSEPAAAAEEKAVPEPPVSESDTQSIPEAEGHAPAVITPSEPNNMPTVDELMGEFLL
jgi:DNA anti-recombination protein RmuC